MRADIHDGPEHMLQSEAGYIDARPLTPARQNLLQRTAGPYIRVMSRHRSKQRYLSGSLAAVGEAAVAIECETEMRSQRSDGRILLRIRIGTSGHPRARRAGHRSRRFKRRVIARVEG